MQSEQEININDDNSHKGVRITCGTFTRVEKAQGDGDGPSARGTIGARDESSAASGDGEESCGIPPAGNVASVGAIVGTEGATLERRW